MVDNIGLDWQDLTHIAQTIDTLLPVIQNDNTENWVNATTELLDIWDNNISLQKQLKETTNLDWTEFKQLVAIGQTTATAIDQRSINSWINALKTTLDWALSENSFDNQKVNQIINKAQENNNTESWVNAVDDLLGVAKDATELRNKLGGITGVEWEDFKQIIEAGQAIATAIEEDKFTAWRDALTTTINIWVDDATLQKEIENQTGFKWEQLTRIGNTYEAIRKADKNGDVTAWLQATDKILILWENDSTLPDQLKTLTGLEWQDLKDFIEVSQTIDTAIEQETYETWRDALKETINFWVSDQTLNQNLESLIGLNWEQIDKIGQASDALYDAYGKVEDIIKNAISSDNYKDWIKGIESVYDLWKDDPILRERVQDGGQVIWDEIESFFLAKETVENQDKKQTIQTTIEKTINETETTIKQKLENTIGLSWTQVKAIVKSGQIIAEAVQENQIDQWIEASDEILDIWEKDADLTKFLQDNYEIGWKDIKIRVETGQEIATAIDTNTIEGWAVSLNNIINIWAKDIPLTTDQQVKLEETEKLINETKNLNSPNDIQLWQEVTNQLLVLWESEDDLQNYLQNKAQLSWKDLSKTVLSGQILGTKSNDIEQSISDLGEVLDIWQTDPELPHILEDISDYSWQRLNDFQHDIEAKITNPILNNGDDDNLLNQFNLNEFNLVTGNSQNLGEADTITLDHNLQTITLDQTYNNPVIFAPSVSFNGGQLATPRITNVTPNSFDIYLQEPSNMDGLHIPETLSYLVMEKGTYQLSDGTLLEVGTLNTDGTTNTSDTTLTPWETIEFDIDFAQTPVIFSQVQTDNDSDLVRTRQQNATADGFEVVMEKDEIKARNGEGHSDETIGYLAIASGSGTSDGVTYQAASTSDSVTHDLFNINFGGEFTDIPHFLANISTYDGPDPSTLRFQNLTTNGVQVTIQEDTTFDDETNHTTEVINYLAVDGDNPLQGTAYDPLTGNRAIIGTDGNDYLLGLKDNDTRTGKGGHDIFVLESNQGTDTITDFELGIDQIGLTDGLTFGSLTLTDINNDTVVMFNNQELTILKGVNSTELTSDHFVGVNV
ncbi:hypothetical protein [Crocosphaera sp.]|uniref:hypothetical protein n=1 Tax=Crocosphaera sp. TaxID=2729996 RepID=UPI003F269B45|nr:hypothetical protein [Crocosphaera sp.]